MARPARSIQEIEGVREEILRHAAAILADEGYSGLSMAKIGARMGMTSPNVYNYFANKEHVYLEIHNRAFGLLYDTLRAAVQRAENPPAKVGELVKAYLEFGLHNGSYYEIMFCINTPKYSDYVGTSMEEIVLEARQVSLKVFELALEAVKEASFPLPEGGEEEIGLLAVQTWAMLHGLIALYNNRILGAAVEEPEELIREIVERILRNLGFSPGSGKAGADISFEREEWEDGI